MATEFNVVDVWLGDFPSEIRFSEYLAEIYSVEDDKSPISQFAADQKQWFYDHDFVERYFFEKTTDLPRALSQCSFISSYINDVVATYKARELPPVNVALLVFGNAIRTPRSVSSNDYKLVHLGRFQSDPGP